MYRIKRQVFILLVIVLAFLIQTSFCKFIPILNNGGSLILVFVTCFSFLNNIEISIFAGLIAGLIIDVNSGIYMGIYELIFMYIAYFSSKLGKIFKNDNINIILILIIFWELIYNIMIYIFTFLIRQKYEFTDYFFYLILPDIVMTVIYAVLLYKPIIIFSQKLKSINKDHYVK